GIGSLNPPSTPRRPDESEESKMRILLPWQCWWPGLPSIGGQATPPTELCRRTGNCIHRIVLCVSPESQTSSGVVVKIVGKPRSGEHGKFLEFPETPRTLRAP